MATWTSRFPGSGTLIEETRIDTRIKDRVEAILRILDVRGIDIPDTHRERIAACADLDTLDTWFDRAVTAGTSEERSWTVGDLLRPHRRRRARPGRAHGLIRSTGTADAVVPVLVVRVLPRGDDQDLGSCPSSAAPATPVSDASPSAATTHPDQGLSMPRLARVVRATSRPLAVKSPLPG